MKTQPKQKNQTTKTLYHLEKKKKKILYSGDEKETDKRPTQLNLYPAVH